MAVRIGTLRAGRPLFPKRLLIITFIRVWVNPRAIEWLEGLGQGRNPMTSSGIEPAASSMEYNASNNYVSVWKMPFSGMLRRVTLVRTDISEERTASIIRDTRIGEVRTLAVTNNRSSLRRRRVRPKRRFLQQPHGVTSQKTAFFVVTVVKTSNLT
jgi:hypothetical protein